MTGLRIGLPKGRLRERSTHLAAAIATAGIDAVVYSLRLQDIPGLVATGHLDAGVTGEEWIAESGAVVDELLDLHWYSIRLSLIARDPDFDLDAPVSGVTVASEYPNLARRYIAQHTRNAVRVIPTHGSTETYVPSLASAAIDCVETGDTLRARGLVAVDDLMRCSVVLIARPGLTLPEELLEAAGRTIGNYRLENA
ncbi:ATP phosphoribosyltransferase [Curtobacterium sp. 9128]|uniref:ATP phosphoribosyltransferase n=1 Tax=Curtobacterium sp. 9128 TaxID=1793722 RepID=UPI0011A680A2|nr:ATP phosphoribosyltransferase [Curtobacterium sp. 9128]